MKKLLIISKIKKIVEKIKKEKPIEIDDKNIDDKDILDIDNSDKNKEANLNFFNIGMSRPTDFSQNKTYFYYGWNNYNGNIEIRRRERKNGNLMKAIIINKNKLYSELWNERETLLCHNF